ncbi:MAG TPA: PQQ-binding-like beta-propeller repeat protein [Bryobacteraceae bacterium]|nr:PQQ-binding-like beta-propeller repeat protein [Bryobacteraceae bacterium]
MTRRTWLQLAAGAPVLAQNTKQGTKPGTTTSRTIPPKGAAGAKLPAGVPWTQWGGPHRNFQTEATGIKDQWPKDGPRVVWKRPLGEGYSSAAVEGNFLYTMYGRSDEEVLLACDAATGKTLWEHATPIQFRSDAAQEMGNGPYTTPLIIGDRLYATGVQGRLQCLDKTSGKMLWTQQLWDEYKGSHTLYGYASSPLAYGDTIVVPVGARGKSMMSFKQSDGSVVWAKNDVPNAYCSPLLINVDGMDQVAVVMDGSVIGVNPKSGDLQWKIPFKASYGIAISTPVWAPGNLLFVSAEYDAGAKVIHLTRKGQQTTAEEVWSSNRLRLHHGNAMLIDDILYFSSGGKGSVAILTAVELRTGKIRWQERSIPKATFVWADQKLITLDGDGNLMIAHPSPQAFVVSAKAELMTSISWSPPTLVGTRLYMRDRRNMMAVDLG